MTRDHEKPRVFLTGATGYVGGRLASRLLDAGHRVRCLVRAPQKLYDRPWAKNDRVEIVQGDLSDADATAEAMRGCGPAYYLVHSMISAGKRYAAVDRQLASTFAEAAERAGISRIIYLGGLGELGDNLSEHLDSRREVETILEAGSVPVTVFRAGMIIGSGSASFEILRYLVERLPVMITPKWVETECQPIGIRNVLRYLVDCLSVPETIGRTFEIGGADIVTYRHLMHLMAKELGLHHRWIFPVPFFTPRLSSFWIHLVTPLGHEIAQPLAEGLRNRIVCRNDEAVRLMPQRLLSAHEAIMFALGKIRRREVESIWSAAGAIPGDPDWAGGTLFVDRRTLTIDASPESVWAAVCRLGGTNGWYAADRLWSIRGWIDRLVGGPGHRRGRRDPERIEYGEALDFWRVTGVVPHRRLALRAEMRVPGEAQLEFTIDEIEGRSRLEQTARFSPRGLAGMVYWYSVLPAHNLVFKGMLEGIREAAEAREASRRGELRSAENNHETVTRAG